MMSDIELGVKVFQWLSWHVALLTRNKGLDSWQTIEVVKDVYSNRKSSSQEEKTSWIWWISSMGEQYPREILESRI